MTDCVLSWLCQERQWPLRLEIEWSDCEAATIINAQQMEQSSLNKPNSNIKEKSIHISIFFVILYGCSSNHVDSLSTSFPYMLYAPDSYLCSVNRH